MESSRNGPSSLMEAPSPTSREEHKKNLLPCQNKPRHSLGGRVMRLPTGQQILLRTNINHNRDNSWNKVSPGNRDDDRNNCSNGWNKTSPSNIDNDRNNFGNGWNIKSHNNRHDDRNNPGNSWSDNSPNNRDDDRNRQNHINFRINYSDWNCTNGRSFSPRCVNKQVQKDVIFYKFRDG